MSQADQSENPADAILQLFISAGIAAEPAAATEHRNRMVSELAEIKASGRRPGETDSAFQTKFIEARDAYQREIRRILFDPASYEGWHPSPEDWIQLCIVLAKRHGESGFEFSPPKSDIRAENTFHQDNLIYGALQNGAKTVAEAARQASKAIDKGLAQGLYSEADGTDSVIKSIGSKSLESGYSARKNRCDQDPLPPSLRGFLDVESQTRSLVAAALSMTRWPEERFYSPDAIDDCLRLISEEHTMGPPDR